MCVCVCVSVCARVYTTTNKCLRACLFFVPVLAPTLFFLRSVIELVRLAENAGGVSYGRVTVLPGSLPISKTREITNLPLVTFQIAGLLF